MSRSIRSWVWNETVSVFTTLVSVVRSPDEQRQNFRLKFIANHQEGISEWTTPIIGIFAIKLEFEGRILNSIHPKGVDKTWLLLASSVELAKYGVLSGVITNASFHELVGLNPCNSDSLLFAARQLLNVLVNTHIFHACKNILLILSDKRQHGTL